MAKKLKAAIIGFGGMGHCHAAQYKGQKDVDLIALCDIDPKKLQTTDITINIGNSGKTDLSKLRKFTSYEDMLAADLHLDILDICLPTDLHCQYAVRALKDGFNVLCEKPMALNVRDCQKMIAAEKRTGRKLMIAQCLRFSLEYDVIREAVKSRKYGKLLRLDLRRNSNTPPGWFRDIKRSGGALMDLHIHDLDYVLSLFGTPQEVVAYGASVVSGGIDDSIAHLHYKNGPLVSSEGSWARSGFQATAAAVFEKGTIEISSAGVTLRQTDKPVKKIKVTGHNMYFNEIAYFAACVKNGKRPEKALPESTCDTIRMIALEQQSIKNGSKILKVR